MPRVKALLRQHSAAKDAVRARMGQRLHLRLPAHGALPPRPRAVRRRLGARRVAVRRARRQLRRAGRREPGLEARPRAARRSAGDALLDSYASEREYAADENILNSTRATDFITPKSEISRLFRDAVLDLAREHAFARTLVNSGRLSVPATLHGSPLNTPDARRLRRARWCPAPPAADAPLARRRRAGWLLRQLGAGLHALVVRRPSAAALRPTALPAAMCWRSACRRPCRCRTGRRWRAALRPAARHRLPAAPRPARLRALARARRRAVRAALARARWRMH